MEWIGIDSQMAADAMMERLDGMHDWYVSGFSYDPLSRAGGTDLSLGRFKTETDSLVVGFRYDSESRDGVYPEFEMMFQEVYQLSNVEEPATSFASRMGAAFASGWRGFVGTLESLAVALAYGWVWLLLLVAVGTVAGRLLWKRRRRERQAASKESENKP